MCDCDGAFLNGGGTFFLTPNVGSIGDFDAFLIESDFTTFLLYCVLIAFNCFPDVDVDGDEIEDTDDTFGIFFIG